MLITSVTIGAVSDVILKVKDLTKSYDDRQVVKGISFEVKKGEIFGILGPNGAGKTTTLEMIETLRDNIGSKMDALVKRGAPRDFVDIHRVVEDGLVDGAMCWKLWREKNPEVSAEAAKGQALTHLTRLEARRPLEKIADLAERQGAERLRRWFNDCFLKREEL